MPHLRIEYSANLDGRADIAGLCETLRKTILAAGPFELGAVRVRAFRADHVALADALAENAFIDMQFRIGAGRTEAEKKAAGEAMFSAASAFLAPLFATPHFALSLDIAEIDPGLSWKKNAIHPRTRAMDARPSETQ